MKKFLALILALSLIFVLASCSTKLSGTYVNEKPVHKIKYEFKKNNVTVTDSTILGDVTYSGKYEIFKDKESGEFKITFTFDDNNAINYNKTYTFEETEGGFKLNGELYKKNN